MLDAVRLERTFVICKLFSMNDLCKSMKFLGYSACNSGFLLRRLVIRIWGGRAYHGPSKNRFDRFEPIVFQPTRGSNPAPL